MNNVELWRYGAGTDATAENRHIDRNFYSPFLYELDILELFIMQKNTNWRFSAIYEASLFRNKTNLDLNGLVA